MTPRERAVVAVASAGALTDAHRAAIRSLHRAQPERTATSRASDVTLLDLAARMAQGLPISEDAMREVGFRYLAAIVELGRQVDARMSAEADGAKLSPLVAAVRSYLETMDIGPLDFAKEPWDWSADERDLHKLRCDARAALRKLVTP